MITTGSLQSKLRGAREVCACASARASIHTRGGGVKAPADLGPTLSCDPGPGWAVHSAAAPAAGSPGLAGQANEPTGLLVAPGLCPSTASWAARAPISGQFMLSGLSLLVVTIYCTPADQTPPKNSPFAIERADLSHLKCFLVRRNMLIPTVMVPTMMSEDTTAKAYSLS
jgi:hypothetical protein